MLLGSSRMRERPWRIFHVAIVKEIIPHFKQRTALSWTHLSLCVYSDMTSIKQYLSINDFGAAHKMLPKLCFDVLLSNNLPYSKTYEKPVRVLTNLLHRLVSLLPTPSWLIELICFQLFAQFPSPLNLDIVRLISDTLHFVWFVSQIGCVYDVP